MTAPTVRPAVHTRPLLIAFYVVALALALPPIMEFFLVSAPYRLGNTQWRFGAIGLYINSFAFSPLLGLALALFSAVQLGHRRVARTLAVLALVMGAMLLLALPLFALDFLQVRAGVNPQAKRAFDLTSMKAAVSGAIMMATALALGFGGWRATATPGLRAAGRSQAQQRQTTIVVGGNQAEASQA